MGKTRFVLVGTGGMGEGWCRRILPPFVADGRAEIVAAVDTNESMLINAGEGLRLPSTRLYTNLDRALADHPADAMIIVVPPAFHEQIVDVALAHRLDILSEKPITADLASSARVVRKVREAGVRMGITMNHRFDADKSTLRGEIQSARSGQLDYLTFRFTADMRAFGRWSRFRHEMDHPMLIEGSVHHLDIIADLAGAPCLRIFATTWRPPWAEYWGDTNVLVVMTFANGVHAQYEAATATAVKLNGWSHEYIRAECELATVILDRREVRRYPYDPGRPAQNAELPYADGVLIKPPPGRLWAHAKLVEEFLGWRDGGPPMETDVAANLRSMMLVEAAIKSSATGSVVDVASLLPEEDLPAEYQS